MSNYDYMDPPEKVRADEPREVRCPAHCYHGLVEVHGQETDCITCGGDGSILV